mgnify:CR=1 FL=1
MDCRLQTMRRKELRGRTNRQETGPGRATAAIWATTDSVPLTILARTLSGVAYSALAISGTLAMRSLLPRELAATGQGMYQVTATGAGTQPGLQRGK